MTDEHHDQDSVWADRHIGRSWSGTELEDSCPCPKAPCGLALAESTDPECPEHPTERYKTMRQVHGADHCPGPRKTKTPEPTTPDEQESQPAEALSPPLRSFYLEHAPPEVQRSLRYLHGKADRSLSIADKIHADTVLTYVAQLTRQVARYELALGMAGLLDDDQDGES